MRCSHNCQQCACTASNAHVRLQAIEYLNISRLVIDFATSPVRTGNSFFDAFASINIRPGVTRNTALSARSIHNGRNGPHYLKLRQRRLNEVPRMQ